MAIHTIPNIIIFFYSKKELSELLPQENRKSIFLCNRFHRCPDMKNKLRKVYLLMRVKERNTTGKPEAFKEKSPGTEKCCCTTFCSASYTPNKVVLNPGIPQKRNYLTCFN